MATRKEIQELQRLLEAEKFESQRMMEELLETVRGMTLRNEHDQFHNGDGSGVGEDYKYGPKQKWRKLTIPIFDGEDAFGWTSRMERYFESEGVGDHEKIQASMIAMEGKALTWYKRWEFCAQISTWEELKTAIIRRFEPSRLQNPYELLPSLKQMGTVEDYREQFEFNAGPLVRAEKEYLKGIFVNGLKDVVKA